ncbi:MAG: hypothetical protein NW224_21990 [Leptolyngbyaceae cyanobacterium bins.302]|nr:hypothetical protein [Leptolyngbyaceae cyanobacterium bins.302]
MQQNRLVTLVGILMLAIAGCASEETPPVATSPSPAPSPVTASPAPAASPTLGQPANQSPLVAQRPAPAVPGLIPSTNAQEREKQVRTEINSNRGGDPFAALPPDLPKPTETKPVPNVAQLPNNRPSGNNNSPQRSPNAGNRGNTGARNGNQGGVTVAGIPPQRAIGDSPTIPQPQDAEEGAIGTYIPPVLPARPTADAAQAIEVTGVVQVGGTTQAIVQSPDEPSSRYVSVGQRISNGRVLVKRIEMNPGGEPTVFFEQNGVEIAKSVGEKAPTAQAKTS